MTPISAVRKSGIHGSGILEPFRSPRCNVKSSAASHSGVNRRCQILLVEDNQADIHLIGEALKRTQIPHDLSVAKNGDEALALVRRQRAEQHPSHPDLILLDLNLPGKTGREVLREIKTDPSLYEIPVVVLTSSEAQDDILAAYCDRANCYVVKPSQLDDYIRRIRSVAEFWCRFVTLPPRVQETTENSRDSIDPRTVRTPRR